MSGYGALQLCRTEIIGLACETALSESPVIVNALDHLYRLSCFAYAFHSAPRLSGGATDPSRSAGLCIQRAQCPHLAARSIIGAVLSASCACAWIRETSAVGIHDVPDGNGVRSFSSCSPSSCAFAPSSRQVCRLIGHTSKDSSFSDLEVLGHSIQWFFPTQERGATSRNTFIPRSSGE